MIILDQYLCRYDLKTASKYHGSIILIYTVGTEEQTKVVQLEVERSNLSQIDKH